MRTNEASLADFRKCLGQLRERKGLTQLQLSRYSGLDLLYIQQIESGSIDPELVTILTIADILDVGIKDLLDYQCE